MVSPTWTGILWTAPGPPVPALNGNGFVRLSDIPLPITPELRLTPFRIRAHPLLRPRLRVCHTAPETLTNPLMGLLHCTSEGPVWVMTSPAIQSCENASDTLLLNQPGRSPHDT